MAAVVRALRWFYHEFGIVSIQDTGRNAYLIMLARTLRMFAHGTTSLVLAIFSSALKFSDRKIGAFMTLTLLGDLVLGALLTLVADRVGRRRILLVGSLLMMISGIAFALFENYWILLLAAIVGVISVTGGDFGPFRSIEESIIAQLTTPATRSDVLAWYVTLASLGSSLGSEASGRLLSSLQAREGWTPVDAYHALFWLYTAMGVVNVVLVLGLTDECELHSTEKNYSRVNQNDDSDDNNEFNDAIKNSKQVETSGLRRLVGLVGGSIAQISGPTRTIMYKLWFLLGVDSLADGMVPYSMTNYYMDIKFHPSKSTLGDVTSISYFLGAIGAAFAGPLARKIGLINTMVFTHIPSSMAVLLFSLPSYFWMTAGFLLLRTALNPMDQAPRAAFIAAVTRPEERTAIIGITSMVRTLAAMAGPTITGVLAANEQFWIAFVVAGIFRLAYDFGLYALFINVKLNEHEDTHSERSSITAVETTFDEEQTLEMHSLGYADQGALVSDSGVQAESDKSSNTGLQIGDTVSKVRSRSPQRPH